MEDNTFTIDNMLTTMTNMVSSKEEKITEDEEKEPQSSDDEDIDEDMEEDMDDGESMDSESDSESGSQEKDITLFTEELRRDYIDQYYPDLKEVSYQELQNFTRVVRNEKGYITDPLHRTLPFISKFEKTRIIGLRTIQLDNDAKPYITDIDNIIDSVIIAEMELNQKKLPFIICRPLPNGSREFWKLSDLEYIETI